MTSPSSFPEQRVAQALASIMPPPPTTTTTTTTGSTQPAFDLTHFWTEQMQEIGSNEPDFKNHALPLARIKKVMKTDQDVKMISAEAPILFAKGCEMFITELTRRAWVHAEENKRRTLQRSDVATAISKTDMCDFLIDIVPREEANRHQVVYEDNNNNNYYTAYGQVSRSYLVSHSCLLRFIILH
ncbi:histone-fold-containing protein [Gilbertella persicaria]|uniref:histone-fold-containing protein n=1 Tax=Gilbertella persicaria TaxID=101096 RepID=UPI00221F9906|nr:histone-fold-containing protein [Gilbertella persicaria]KAI8098184.1 histone-fold-containing protein [Gilbertella persicaria]